MVLPHAWLDPSESKVVELVLPFRHVLDYFALNYSSNIARTTYANSLGALHFIVFNTLQVSTGTSGTVYITPSVYAQSPNVHVPTAYHGLESPATVKILKPRFADDLYPEVIKASIKELDPLPKDFVEVIESGLSDAPGAILSSIKAGEAIASGSPGMVTSTLKAISDVSKVFSDLDRPLSYGEIMLPCNRLLSPLAHGSGVDASIRLSLIENSQTQSSSSGSGDAHKEMDLSSILKIPTVISILTWSSATGPDVPLGWYPVVPNYCTFPYAGPATTLTLALSNLGA